MSYDIFLVGVGGQGILTIGEVLTEVAAECQVPANFFPSKGMAQRGGFVKAQLRLGKDEIGPNIPEGGADLVVAMEQSEALKAVRYVKPGGDFVLYADVWEPMAVLLGKAPYPSLEDVSSAVENTGARLVVIPTHSLPRDEVIKASANLFVLGVTMQQTALKDIFTIAQVESVIRTHWEKTAERNIEAFRAGFAFQKQTA